MCLLNGVDTPRQKWSDLKSVSWHQAGSEHAKEKHTLEEIAAKLRQVHVFVSHGSSMTSAVRQIGVTEVTYYR
jgi:hypothetical protein